MPSQATLPSGPDQPVKRAQPSTSTGRLRSACDSCHQAKTKCSGGSHCLACQVSQIPCTYSPGNRLGRPKGSKNKRTLMQEKENKSKNNNTVDTIQWTDPEPCQQQLDPMAVDFDLEHAFDTPLATDFAIDNSPSHMLSQDLNSLIDEIGGTHVDTTNSEEVTNSLFAQTSCTTLALSPYCTPPSDTPPTSGCDSEYVSGNIAYSSADNSILPSPQSLFTSPETSSCSCLQQQVQLVYQLEDLQYSCASAPPIDCVLRGVQMAQTPWKSLMQCNRCQSQDNQNELFLLFAMSIRILLAAAQRLNTKSRPIDASYEAAIGPAFSGTSDVGVSVGTFELTGEAKTEVITVALQGALRSVTSALLHLWGRFGLPSQLSSRYLATSNRNSTSTASHESSIDFYNSATTESPKPTQFDPPLMASLGGEDTGTLLDALQCTMQAMKQDVSPYG